MLAHSGIEITPDALVPQVYLPQRRGSLQLELKAAARRSGRLPYEIRPDTQAWLAEISAGRPVLVLQNLGLAWLPRWHYAVVVGYDADRHRVLLRSGRQARRQEQLRRFQQRWSLAGRWGLVMLRPGTLPAGGEPDPYLEMVVDAEGLLPADALTRALLAGTEAWPDHANLGFAAANQLKLDGDPEGAASHYRRTLALEPKHLGALNNYADLLLGEGCASLARPLILEAERQLDDGSPFRGVVQATRQAIDAAASNRTQQGAPDSDERVPVAQKCRRLAGS